MRFNSRQQSAITRFRAWWKDKDKPFFTIGGYAGTGKSTLVSHLTSGLGNVVYATHTGKAAHVLTKKGCTAQTVCSLIYVPKKKSEARLNALRMSLDALLSEGVSGADIKRIRQQIQLEEENMERPSFSLNLASTARDADLVVIDEGYMITRQMGEDILSFGTPVLFLGDPGQLPPIGGEAFLSSADVTLTQNMRSGDDVIELATRIREGRTIRDGRYGNSLVSSSLDRDEIKEAVLEASQTLCGTNATRISTNSRYRELQGRKHWVPVEGDRVIGLRNNPDNGILNGQMFNVYDAAFDGSLVGLTLQEEGCDSLLDVDCLPHYFQGKEPDRWEKAEQDLFDYAYALTVHKAQGSEFDTVVLFDEWRGQHYRKWLYTAITRARDSITIVR